MSQRRLHAYLYFLAVSFIWGIAGVVIKFTLQGIDPLSFLSYRFAISAGIALGYFLLFRYKLPKTLSAWIAIVIYSLFSTTFALSALFYGIERTTVLNLSLVTLTLPLLVEVAGVLFLGEKITRREKIGSAIAIIGAAFTIIEPILASNGNSGTFVGNLLIAAYMFFDITALVILKKLLRSKTSATDISQFSFIVGFASLIPVIIFVIGTNTFINTVISLPLKYQLGVWFMAIFSGTIAYVWRAKAQKTIEISESALFGYLVPVFGVPLAVLWLKETITPVFVIGAIIIAIGVFIAETKSR